MADPLFAAQFDERIPVLDLHGLTVYNAEHELDAFLHLNQSKNEAVVKIIHGKGSGQLREAMKQFLGKHPLVKRFEDAQAPHEQAGVLYVLMTV